MPSLIIYIYTFYILLQLYDAILELRLYLYEGYKLTILFRPVTIYSSEVQACSAMIVDLLFSWIVSVYLMVNYYWVVYEM